MQPLRKLAGWTACVLALTAVLYVVAEQLDFIRTDSLAALACTPLLLDDKATPTDLLHQYRNTIADEASRHALPPELLAAVIYGHQVALTPLRRFTDCAGSALGYNLSLGLAQIRISTAVSNDNADFEALPAPAFKQYRALLLDPLQNIRQSAIELQLLRNRSNRFPDVAADALLDDPFAMALLLSEYRAGRQQTPAASSKLMARAFGDLQYLMGDTLYVFGRDAAEVARIQQQVAAYLDYINCDSGIFNASACTSWRAETADTD